MPDTKIVPVSTRQQQRAFVQLAWDLYAGDPNWMPPIIRNQQELLNYRPHPFYEDGICQTFLAERDGKFVGRIAAIVHHAHNRRYQEKRGFFGFFESINDLEVSRALFRAAFEWLRGQGMTHVRGPMSPSFNYEMGLLVEGFDRPSSFMLPYNAPWYESLVADAGFEKVQDLYAYGAYIGMLADVDDTIRMVAREAPKRLGLTLRPIDTRRFREEIGTFLKIYNEANQPHWGFVPLSDAEVNHMSASLRHLIVPKLTRFAEAEGKPVGTLFGLLDYNPIIREINGRLFPFGFIKLFTRRKRLKRVRLVATHVLPAWQKWGVGLVLLNDIADDAISFGITEAEFSWVAESNLLSRQSIERGKAVREKVWRIYDRSLDGAL